MTIVCVRFPFYATSIERRDKLTLAQHPLVLGYKEASAVYSMSGEAAQDGVQLDVPLRQARLMCPSAEFLPSALTYYERTAHELAAWLLDFTQQVEPTPTRPALVYYVDGTFSTESATIEYAGDIGRVLRSQTHLTPSIGVARNKFAAYIAAKHVAAGRLLPISAEQTTHFLSTIPLHSLSLPDRLKQRCLLLGIKRLGDLAALPSDQIPQQFGDAGRTLFQLARGIDARPIQHYPLEQKEAWQQSFEDPINDLVGLQHILSEGTRDLVKQLRKGNLSARGLMLQLALDSGDTITLREQFSQPTQAFRHIQRTLQTLVNQNKPGSGVMDVQIGLSYLAPILQRQLNLFEAPVGDDSLHEAIGDLADRHGQRFYQIASFRPKSRFPEKRYRISPHAALLG